jgi:hypothetical protein
MTSKSKPVIREVPGAANFAYMARHAPNDAAREFWTCQAANAMADADERLASEVDTSADNE